MLTTNNISKLSSVLFGLLILFSSTNIFIDVHYCQGKIESVAFFGKNASCKMMKKSSEKKSLHCKHQVAKEKNSKKNSKKNCCNNEKLVLKKIDNLTVSVIKHFKISNDSYTRIAYVVNNFSLQSNSYFQDIKIRPPPLPKTNFQVSFQTFLI